MANEFCCSAIYLFGYMDGYQYMPTYLWRSLLSAQLGAQLHLEIAAPIGITTPVVFVARLLHSAGVG
jgi:hypothetical protein